MRIFKKLLLYFLITFFLIVLGFAIDTLIRAFVFILIDYHLWPFWEYP